MLSSTPASVIGQIVPDYELLRRIGGGAYGEVWLARSKATGILRAAKIVWRHSFDDARPFYREFKGILRFERVCRECPNQLALFHVGRSDGKEYFYYVMELADNLALNADCKTKNEALLFHSSQTTLRPVSAEEANYSPRTLRADLQNGRLLADRVLEIGIALAEALGHLHRHALVHRDVKPSNVIFVDGRLKLADIGLVTDASDTRSIVGTEGYLPPEGPGTPQADIFALGKVLYEAMTGLDRRNYPALPGEANTWVDANLVFELNEIILQACAANPGVRYGNTEELLADLGRLRQGQSVSGQRIARRRWTAVKKAGVVLCILALLGGFAYTVGRLYSPPALSRRASSFNATATDLYANGMRIVRRNDYRRFGEASANFNQAVQLEPRFAPPYAGLFELHLKGYSPAGFAWTEVQTRQIAQALNQLAPGSAPACCAASVLGFFQWDFAAARKSSLQAIRADPSYELAHTWYAFILTMWGRPEEARAELKAAQALTASSASVSHGLAHTFYVERSYPKAIEEYRAALKADPNPGLDYYYIARAFQAQGDYANAIENFKARDLANGRSTNAVGRSFEDLASALNSGGARAYWEAQWRLAERSPRTLLYWKATVKIHLGETDAALTWLEESCQRHETQVDGEPPLNYLLFDECWDGLRENPRFKAILQKIGFSEMMPHGG